MKRIIIIVVFVIMFSFITSILLAQNFVYAVFNIPAETARENYLPGGLDDYLANCDYFQRSWDPVGPSGGWLDNQFNSPDIATPPAAGPEGGNALYGNSNDASHTREGYWIWLNPAITNQGFTIEVFFRLDELNPNFAEHKMSNIISSFWMSDGGTSPVERVLELRFFGSATDLGLEYPHNQLEMMTNSAGAEHNVRASAGLITAGNWYFAAIVYDHIASQASLYFGDPLAPGGLNPTLIGSVDPLWTPFVMNWLCIAAWPNPAGSCRDITGYIDAFSVAYSALSPSEFYLLYGSPYIAHTKANWQIYE